MNKIFKNGWTLAELCVTLVALGILISISIQVVKPRKLFVTPFAYAAVKNLQDANYYVISRCVNKLPDEQGGGYGDSLVPGCDAQSGLPETTAETLHLIQSYYSNADLTLDSAELNDVYCTEVANSFSTIGRINCKYPNASVGDDFVKLPKPGSPGNPNFQTSNMVAYYFLEQPWVDILKAAPREGDTTTMNETVIAKYKEIFIDINGDDEPNKLGEDQFPLRIYKTGEVIPSRCDNKNYKEDPTVMDPASPGALMKSSHCPSSSELGAMETTNWLETSHPFTYYTTSSTKAVENADINERWESRRVVQGASYQEAACKSGTHVLIPRAEFCKDSSNNSIDMITECKNNVENGQYRFCFTRLSAPGNPGLFKLPM